MKKVICFILLTGMAFSVIALTSANPAFAEKKPVQNVKIMDKNAVGLKLKEMMDSGKIKVTPGGDIQMYSASYRCSPDNDSCVCRGGAGSADCQAMFNNICPKDSDGKPVFSCIGEIICSCEYLGGIVGGAGGINDPAQTQTAH